MIKLNDNFRKLEDSYLFSTVRRKVEDFRAVHPEIEIIRMDIGDVTRPICPAAIKEMHRAVDDMGDTSTFHGYGPEQGYPFLREAIVKGDYLPLGIGISADEIFVGDGAKSDIGNFGDILSGGCSVAVTDPVYPVYVDSNVMSGRSDIVLMPTVPDNDFNPDFPVVAPDIIYLCSPNNPTGTAMKRSDLKRWVDYARANGSLILFDSAYEAFVSDPEVPHSIYEIEGALDVAVEFRSFSKTAGFTGLRCGYTVVPRGVEGVFANGSKQTLRELWLRRQSTRFNGASYIVQRAAAALYTPEGRRSIAETIDYYHTNAGLLREGLEQAGFTVYGGENSPYLWVKTPHGIGSWEFFDTLLHKGLTCTPGAGFGSSGEGFVRFTAFNTKENTAKAVERLFQR